MRAVLLKAYGPPQNLVIGEAPRPQIGGNEILARVHSAGVNPVDWKVRAGWFKMFTGLLKPPLILGHDFAGTVAEIGSGVRGYAVGDRIYGMTDALKGEGTYAEYVRLGTENFAPMPAGLSFEEAAAIPLASTTAYQGLMNCAHPKSGEEVLINGASGGVGMAAFQIAKAVGCRVTAVCATHEVQLLKSMGADYVIDYMKDDICKARDRYDVFFDCSGYSSFAAAKPTLKNNGRFVTTNPVWMTLMLGPLLNRFRPKKATVVTVVPNSADLQAITGLIEQGKFKTVIAKTYPLEQVVDAHILSETRRITGKLVLQILQPQSRPVRD